MNPGEKASPGTVVSPAEINAILIRLQDLKTHIETNKRHLAMIESRLAALAAVVLALVPEEAPPVPEEEEG